MMTVRGPRNVAGAKPLPPFVPRSPIFTRSYGLKLSSYNTIAVSGCEVGSIQNVNCAVRPRGMRSFNVYLGSNHSLLSGPKFLPAGPVTPVHCRNVHCGAAAMRFAVDTQIMKPRMNASLHTFICQLLASC